MWPEINDFIGLHLLVIVMTMTVTGIQFIGACVPERTDYTTLELCADELVVGGGVGWSYDRRRRRAAHFSSAEAAWLYGRRRRRRRRQTG